MNYKKYLLALTLGASLVEATTVVVIDGEAIVKTSEAGKALNKELIQQQEQLAAPLKKKEQKIKGLQVKFENDKKSFETAVMKLQGKESELLSSDARDKKESELQAEQARLEGAHVQIQQEIKLFQTEATKLEQKISLEYQKKMNVFDEQIKAVIEKAAAREKWDIVLMQYVYAHPSTDKTQVIIDDLNKAYKPSQTAAPAKKAA